MTIMKVLKKYEWLEMSDDIDENWYDDKEFAGKAKESMVIPSLSLYDLIRLRSEEAAKLVTYEDYYKFVQSWALCGSYYDDQKEICCRHLHEKLTKRFFRRWALDPFMDLTRQRLPILCCEMIIEQLKNEDLWHICLAAQGQNIH
uniref:BACK domain-containing protein n=1 Tax=Trichogramma kaykai TaxID=54128 RepID=A0ABD2WVN7_9HYME